jgi:hypothetical protein
VPEPLAAIMGNPDSGVFLYSKPRMPDTLAALCPPDLVWRVEIKVRAVRLQLSGTVHMRHLSVRGLLEYFSFGRYTLSVVSVCGPGLDGVFPFQAVENFRGRSFIVLDDSR